MTDKLNPAASRRSVLTGAVAGIATFAALPGTSLLAATTRTGRFRFAGPDVPEGFLLDGKPFQIRSGEMHPARIPRPYWLHRIRMAKAMGLNTIAIYVMWNHHEVAEGQWDFKTENRDISAFVQLCQDEGMFVFLRPGPYVCAEWNWGGLPAYLLKDPASNPRHRSDAAYMAASERYIARLAKELRHQMIDRGGPIVMVQVENEYASFGTDLGLLEKTRDIWIKQGIHGPFSISDVLPHVQKSKTYLPGAALGLNASTDFAGARVTSNGNPAWVTEGYTGWITRWGDEWAKKDYRETLKQLMRERASFNFYVVHGGTNFGWSAGANCNDDGSNFEPTITSYDYGAPINEHGAPNQHYHDMRKTIYDATGETPLPIPATPALVAFAPVTTRPIGSFWNALAAPVAMDSPRPMEALGQYTGVILYRTSLPAGARGTLTIDGLRDEAIVLIDGERIGSLSRAVKARSPQSLTIDAPDAGGAATRQLDILVFPFGRVNYGRYITDRKGIIGSVQLDGAPLNGWQAFPCPLDAGNLAQISSARPGPDGLLHRAEFDLDQPGDTYIDMASWDLGLVWVNGNLLGRHCRLGPQTRLFCPAEWLKAGRNEVVVLDLYARPRLAVGGIGAPETNPGVKASPPT